MTKSQASEVDRIIKDVCKRFEVERSVLLGRNRQWINVWPRFIAIAMIHESLALDQRAIARLFGRTQQSISYALGSAKDMEETSRIGRSDLRVMRMRLGLAFYDAQNHEMIPISQPAKNGGHRGKA